MPKAIKPATPARPSSPPDAAAAYDSVQAELDALPSDELASINLDVPQVVSNVLGAEPGILAMADEIVALIDPKHVHHLRNYALAAWYAHLQWLPPTKEAKDATRSMVEEATALRNNLLGDAEALARRGYFDVDAVALIRAGHGYIDLANDLVALGAMFTQKRDEIANKTPVTDAEIKRARVLGPALLTAVGKRERQESPLLVSDRRTRAFTVLVRSYDQVRRAITFLRWDEGDADLIAPSLYKARKRAKSNGASAPEEVDLDAGAEAEGEGPQAAEQPEHAPN